MWQRWTHSRSFMFHAACLWLIQQNWSTQCNKTNVRTQCTTDKYPSMAFSFIVIYKYKGKYIMYISETETVWWGKLDMMNTEMRNWLLLISKGLNQAKHFPFSREAKLEWLVWKWLSRGKSVCNVTQFTEYSSTPEAYLHSLNSSVFIKKWAYNFG